MANEIILADGTVVLPNTDSTPNQIEVANEPINPEPIDQFTNVADNFLQSGYKKFQWAADAVELDKYTEELGLGPISKQLTIDRVKTILAGFMTLQLLNKVKADSFKFIAMGGVGLLVLKNKDQILNVFDKDKYVAGKLAVADKTGSPTDTGIVEMSGMGNCACSKAMGDF